MSGVKKVVKSVGSAFGLGGSATPKYKKVDKKYYDIAKQVKPYDEALKGLFQRQDQVSQAAAPFQTQALTQMGQAAIGQGPSLAEQQLKMAQDRALAQNAALLQAGRGGSAALNQRLLAQQSGMQNRDLAQEAALARLQERDRFLQQAMANDLALQQGAQQSLQTTLMPQQALLDFQKQKIGIANQQAQANAQENAQKRGAFMGAVGSFIGGGGLSKLTSSVGNMFSPGSGFLGGTKTFYDPSTVGDYSKLNKGGLVPGKAVVKGDSEKNDFVKALLSPGEVVVPRTVVAKGPKASSNFVKKAIEKNKGSK